ncbi:flagellar hook-basal body complex protein FliE [bacterium]|nr:flagellar hook-basal body complex protein FliE [bacterium]
MSEISHIGGLGGRIGAINKMPDKVSKPGFGETLGNMLEDVNQTIIEAGKGAEKMASGEVTDLHQVMIAAEKASVGLEMVIEIRNKLLESYKEIMRTQM